MRCSFSKHNISMAPHVARSNKYKELLCPGYGGTNGCHIVIVIVSRTFLSIIQHKCIKNTRHERRKP